MTRYLLIMALSLSCCFQAYGYSIFKRPEPFFEFLFRLVGTEGEYGSFLDTLSKEEARTELAHALAPLSPRKEDDTLAAPQIEDYETAITELGKIADVEGNAWAQIEASYVAREVLPTLKIISNHEKWIRTRLREDIELSRKAEKAKKYETAMYYLASALT